MPQAFLINYGDFGYAKFLVDPRSLLALENDISKIESFTERKYVYNILFDGVKSCRQPGSRLLEMIKNNILLEKSEAVLSSMLILCSQIIEDYIPLTEIQGQK
jgi:hypothetical protein